MAETIFDEIKGEHRDIKQLRGAAEKDPGQFKAFADKLATHVKAEEETFYKPLQEEQKVRDLILEGYEEHHVVDVIVHDIEQETAGSETWQAKFTVMSESLDHHIDEEEKKLFPSAQKLIEKARALQMAEQYTQAVERFTPVGTR
jgi:hemerythrin-like domain-containing protein